MRATEACWALVAATISIATVVRMTRRWGCPLQQVTMRQRSGVLHRRKALDAVAHLPCSLSARNSTAPNEVLRLPYDPDV